MIWSNAHGIIQVIDLQAEEFQRMRKKKAGEDQGITLILSIVGRTW